MAVTNPPLPDKGNPSTPDMGRAGKLPDRRPESMWAGPSSGCDCAICGKRVELDELEYELEYVRSGSDPGVDTHHVHIRCFTALIWKANGGWAAPPRGQA